MAASVKHLADGVDANSTILLQHNAIAKQIQHLDPPLRRMINVVMELSPRHDALKCALKQYLLTDRPLAEIARKHFYTGAALTYWIRKLGLPRRRRGRLAFRIPTAAHERVIALARQWGITEAARRLGISKQRASQVVRRWFPKIRERSTRRGAPLPRPQRRQPRNVVVSFRLSTQEWQLLVSAPQDSCEPNMSGSERARAIVLKSLAPEGVDGHTPPEASTPAPTRNENVYIYSQEQPPVAQERQQAPHAE